MTYHLFGITRTNDGFLWIGPFETNVDETWIKQQFSFTPVKCLPFCLGLIVLNYNTL